MTIVSSQEPGMFGNRKVMPFTLPAWLQVGGYFRTPARLGLVLDIIDSTDLGKTFIIAKTGEIKVPFRIQPEWLAYYEDNAEFFWEATKAEFDAEMQRLAVLYQEDEMHRVMNEKMEAIMKLGREQK